MAKRTTSQPTSDQQVIDQEPTSDQQAAAAPKPYNKIGSSTPFRKPQGKEPRAHVRKGKGGGAKTGGTITHENLLRALGSTLVWTKPGGVLPQVEGRAHTIFDLDTANPSLGRYYPDMPEHHACGSLSPHVLGNMLQHVFLSLLKRGCTVLVDLGAQGEVPWLDFIELNGISPILGESLVSHVPIGSLDSVGTAKSIAQRSPSTPVILYLNEKEHELESVIHQPYGRKLLEEVLALPNVRGAVDFPELRSAFNITSSTSHTLLDVQSLKDASLIDKQICRSALARLQVAWAPATEWLAC